jgi:myo-inositol-1-phosphate synthase
MTQPIQTQAPLLLLVPGIKGAIGTTLSLAARLLELRPQAVLPYLTTYGLFEAPEMVEKVGVAGWDVRPGSLAEAAQRNGVVGGYLAAQDLQSLEDVPLAQAPDPATPLEAQTAALSEDIDAFRARWPAARPVLVNLLPACPECDPEACHDLRAVDCRRFPDLAYALAAVRAGVPVVNFTPNHLALPALLDLARSRGVPFVGRDGKTGQTYIKVVLASALRARRLYVDGWYSLNILGNADGRNLMDPVCARGKLQNKTNLLDELLGYHVGEHYGEPTHKVAIDYYPPRGDAKEAWDVIDIKGLFDLPMSLRINLQGRDSILAAPMALDLARWVVRLKDLGRCGSIPELGFYFKKPEGDDPPLSFEDQVRALQGLARACQGPAGNDAAA